MNAPTPHNLDALRDLAMHRAQVGVVETKWDVEDFAASDDLRAIARALLAALAVVDATTQCFTMKVKAIAVWADEREVVIVDKESFDRITAALARFKEQTDA